MVFFHGSLFHNALSGHFFNLQIFCLYIMDSDFVFMSFLCMQMCVSLYVSWASPLAFFSCFFCPFLVCFYLIFFLLIIINLYAYFYNNDGERKKGVNLGGWMSGEDLEELPERKA